MALKVIKWIGLSAALLAVIAAALVLYVLWPEGGVDMRRDGESASTPDILRDCLLTDTLNIDLAAMRVTCDAELNDAQLNAVLDNAFSAQSGNKALDAVNAYRAWVYDGYIQLKANVTLAGVLPAQVTVNAIPSLEGSKLMLTVQSAKVGKLPLSARQLFALAGVDNGGTDTLAIDLGALPPYVELSSLKARRGGVTMTASVSVGSLAELETIARDIAPDAVRMVRERLMEAMQPL